MSCTLCQLVLPQGALGCAYCVSPPARAEGSPDALRLVTVVVARLVELAALVEADPQRAADLSRDVEAAWLEHGGRPQHDEEEMSLEEVVVSFADDGLVGDIVSHALAAAAQARAQVRRDAAHVWRAAAVALELRVGMATGYAIVRQPDTPAARVMAGPAFALARRLAAAAGPDDILLDEASSRALGKAVVLIEEDPLDADGPLSIPVARVDVETLPRFRPRRRRSSRLRSDLVGRDRELVAVRSVFEDATENSSLRRVVVTGAAGSGRSRFLREVVDTLRGSYTELRVAEAALSRRGAATEPFELLRDLVSSLLGVGSSHQDPEAAGRQLDELTMHEPRLADRYLRARLLMLAGVDSAGDRDVDPEHAEELTQAAVAALLAAAAGAGPLLIVLDDLDDATQAELRSLARIGLTLRERPALMLAGAEDRPESWAEVDETVVMDRLSAEAVRVLVDRLLGRRDALPRAVTEEILTFTGGQPLFVEEMVAALIDAALLEEDAATGSWQLRSGGIPSGFPRTLAGLLAARLDQMPDGDAEVLRLAAIAGERFWLGQIDDLAGRRTALVLRRLEERGWIARCYDDPLDNQVGYRFSHEATRGIVRAEIPAESAAALHVRVARWLAVHAGERFEAWLPAIAWHFGEAGDAAHAASYHQQAGEWALERGDLGLARGQLGRAHRLAPDRQAKMQAALDLGEAHLRGFHYSRCEAALAPVLAWAEERHDPRDVLKCLVLLAGAASGLREFERARRLVERGLELARSLGAVPEEATLLLESSRSSLSHGDEAACLEAIDRCRAIREELGDPLGLAWAAIQRGRCLLQSGALDDAVAAYRVARDLAASLAHELLDARAVLGLGWVRLAQGDHSAAGLLFAEVMPVFSSLGLDRLAVRAAIGRSLVALEEQRWADAANASSDALAGCENRSDALLVALSQATVGHVYGAVEVGRHRMKARQLSRDGAPRLYRGLIALFAAEYLVATASDDEALAAAAVVARETLAPFAHVTFGQRALALPAA